MYTVLLVDDEPHVREGIRDFFDWSDFGVSVILEAGDGIEALEQIRRHAPQVIISDIKMPGMDGIELAGAVHAAWPDIRIILLTGYSEFAYVQKAIRYNVVDYVLKPTKLERLAEVMDKAIGELEKQRTLMDRLALLEQAVESAQQSEQAGWLQKSLQGPIQPPPDITAPFVLAVLDFDRKGQGNGAALALRFRRDLSMALASYRPVVAPAGEHRACVLLQTGPPGGHTLEHIYVGCRDLLCHAGLDTGLSLAIALSAVHGDLRRLPDALDECCRTLEARPMPEGVYAALPPEWRDFLRGVLRALDTESRYQVMDGVTGCLSGMEQRGSPLSVLRLAAAELCALCLQAVPADSGQTALYIDKVFAAQQPADLLPVLQEMLELAFARVRETVDSSHRIVTQTRAYIEAHYQENLKLEQIARHVHCNSSYLSRLYKKESSETITDTITRLRVGKAAELLKTTDLKSYEIAMRAGWEDAAYFSIVFKKYTGKTPKQFRRQAGPYPGLPE